MLPAWLVDVADRQARRMAAENLQRENLCAIEEINAIVDIVNSELSLDAMYLSLVQTPLERIQILFVSLNSAKRSDERGYQVSVPLKETSHKFVRRLEEIFENFPKPLKWRSFYVHDLSL